MSIFPWTEKVESPWTPKVTNRTTRKIPLENSAQFCLSDQTTQRYLQASCTGLLARNKQHHGKVLMINSFYLNGVNTSTEPIYWAKTKQSTTDKKKKKKMT